MFWGEEEEEGDCWDGKGREGVVLALLCFALLALLCFPARPFDYPNHSWIPFSIEKVCTRIPFVLHKERNDSVLIFSKKTSYFYRDTSPGPDTWTWMLNLTNNKHKYNLPLTAKVDGPENHPILEGLVPLGKQTRAGFEQLVSQVQVVLGVG